MNTKANKYSYISILTVLSTLAVVILHVNHFWDFQKENWSFYNAIESIFYFAVPIFIMISGALLIDYRKKYDTKTYFIKRFTRVVIPYFIFSSLYLLIDYLSGNKYTFKSAIELYLNGKGFGIYGFFICLFNVYLCIPFISLIPSEKRKKGFLYLILIGLILNAILPMIFQYTGISFTSDWHIDLLGGYLLFALIDYYIHNYEIKSPIRIMIYILGIASLFIILFGTYNRSIHQGSISTFYKSYTNIFSTLYATSIFLFFKKLDKYKITFYIGKFCNLLSPYCFGVYLIHKIFQSIFINNVSFFDNSIGTDIILIVLLFIISIIIYYLYEKSVMIIKKIIYKIKESKKESQIQHE